MHACTSFLTCVRIKMHGTGISLPSLGIHHLSSWPASHGGYSQTRESGKGDKKRKTAEPLTPASSYSSSSSSSSLFFLLLSSFALESSSVIQGRQAIVIQGPFEGKRNEETHARMKGGKDAFRFFFFFSSSASFFLPFSPCLPHGESQNVMFQSLGVDGTRYTSQQPFRISLWLVPGTILP